MKKIICFLLLGLSFLSGFSQTEWRIIGGIDVTPVTLSKKTSYGDALNFNRITNNRTCSNLGYVGIDLSFGGEMIRFETSVGAGYYKKSFNQHIEIFGGGNLENEGTIYYGDSLAILPMLRASMNFSIGKKNALKLIAFNQGLYTINAGIALERKFGEKFSLSANLYSPISAIEPLYVLQPKIGGGIQLSYVFSRKEKVRNVKAPKSNSSPTVL